MATTGTLNAEAMCIGPVSFVRSMAHLFSAAMSSRNFQRIFTQEIGKAPSLYVEKLRIEAVRRKLELTSLRLGEIAEQCGFASSDLMTRRFRFHLKVKPLDYRARFRSSVGPGKSLRKGHPSTKGSPKIPGRRQQGDVSYRSNDRVSPELAYKSDSVMENT